ncbi:hypothetical protein LINGRAHAP2_LOCUS20709 [Linum grandiflorum]
MTRINREMVQIFFE